jgi:hypothetical protein
LCAVQKLANKSILARDSPFAARNLSPRFWEERPMRLRMLALGIFASLSQVACSGSTSTPGAVGKLTLSSCSSDGSICPVNTLLSNGSTVLIKITALDPSGAAGSGVVTLTPGAGSINNKASDTVTLSSMGEGTAIYSCDVRLDSGCASTATISASWTTVKATVRVTLTAAIPASDGGTTDAGIPVTDAGPSTTATATISFASVTPVSIASQDARATGLPTSAEMSFLVDSVSTLVPGGPVTLTPLAGVVVTFSTPLGENLLALSSGTATTDANGVVTVIAASRTGQGVGHVIAALPLGFGTARGSVGIFGPPSSVVELAEIPNVLGIQGSGIQETGLMTFLVSDAYGTPVPAAQIDFTQSQPQLITLNATSGSTDATGHVSIAYSSGPEVGITSITATAHGTTASGIHAVAVRGARPSASGFYFRCEHGALPVYDLITGYSTTLCHVRLSDRFGNRVGIPTPVNFATEAGAISASVVTTGFDPTNPTSPAEGTATITFSTDVGNGSSPADVVPLEADTNVNQYPQRRAQAEPRHTVGGQVLNPRDQLVTIIAWTQGEEAFVDANHNGKYDQGELFVDEGDPYLDENDDNQYDQVVANGQYEPRFCGATSAGVCPAYIPPNGKWDAQTTIWAPTWIVFAGDLTISTVPSGATTPLGFSPSSCADYLDAPNNDGLHSSSISAPVYVYDQWGNTPVAGTHYEVLPSSLSGALLTLDDATLANTFPQAETFGAFGSLGEGFTYGAVSAANGGPCTTGNGTQCVFNMHFNSFDLGLRGTVNIINNTTSSDTPGVHYAACLPIQSGVSRGNQPPEQFAFSVGVFDQAGALIGSGYYAGSEVITKNP